MTDVARLRQGLAELPFSPEERREVEQMLDDGATSEDVMRWVRIVEANRRRRAAEERKELTFMEEFRERVDFLWKRWPHLTAGEVQARVAWVDGLAPEDRQEVMRRLDAGCSWDDVRGG